MNENYFIIYMQRLIIIIYISHDIHHTLEQIINDNKFFFCNKFH